LAVKLRLRRMGKKRQPIYKVVAADVRSPRDGKFFEAIGLYNPLTDPAQIDIAEDRVLYWLSVGAQPTKTVRNLLSKSGILLRRELVREGMDEAKIELRMDEFFKLHNVKPAEKVQPAESKVVEAEVKTETAAEENVVVVEAEVKTETAAEENVVVEEAEVKTETATEENVVVEEEKKEEISEELNSAAETTGTVSEDSNTD